MGSVLLAQVNAFRDSGRRVVVEQLIKLNRRSSLAFLVGPFDVFVTKRGRGNRRESERFIDERLGAIFENLDRVGPSAAGDGGQQNHGTCQQRQ